MHKKKRKDVESANPGYSLYSTDSEDAVAMTHKGLDRCASLLAQIMEGPGTRDLGQRAKVRAPSANRGKLKKKKKPGGISPPGAKMKLKRKTATSKAGGENKGGKPLEKQKQRKGRTKYHPEVPSSTPQGGSPPQAQQSSAPSHHEPVRDSRSGQAVAHPISESASNDFVINRGQNLAMHLQSDGDHSKRYRGHYNMGYRDVPSSYHGNVGFHHHLYPGQMIPERETDQPRGGQMPGVGPDQATGQRSNRQQFETDGNTLRANQREVSKVQHANCHVVNRDQPGVAVDMQAPVSSHGDPGYRGDRHHVYSYSSYPGVMETGKNDNVQGGFNTGTDHQPGPPHVCSYGVDSGLTNEAVKRISPGMNRAPQSGIMQQQGLPRALHPGVGEITADHQMRSDRNPPTSKSTSWEKPELGQDQLPWQHAVESGVDAATAKHVLRDLVNTLKTMNQRDTAAMDAKLSHDLEGRVCNDNSAAGGNMEYAKTHHLVTDVKEAAVDDMPQKWNVNNVVKRVDDNEPISVSGNGGVFGQDRLENVIDDNQIPMHLPRAQVLIDDVGPKGGQIGNKGEFLMEEANKCAEESPVSKSDNVGDQNMGGNSPDRRKKKKKSADRSSGHSRKGKEDKRPLWEQQRILKFLMMELKTVTEQKENLEVQRLFDEIFDTLEMLPLLTMDSNAQTEIAMALQPLRSENASLRRKLRIANQQAKEIQRQAQESLEGKQQSFEAIALKTLNTTLQQQLTAQQEESAALKEQVNELQQDAERHRKMQEEMERAVTLKDEAHLQSQGEWMTEMASLRKQLASSKQELESFQWKLGSLKRENEYLQRNLVEYKEKLVKAEETNQRLENVLTRLASKPGHGSMVPVSMGPQEPTGTKSETRRTSPKRKRDWDTTERDRENSKVTKDVYHSQSLREVQDNSTLGIHGPGIGASPPSTWKTRLSDIHPFGSETGAREEDPSFILTMPLTDVDSCGLTRDTSKMVVKPSPQSGMSLAGIGGLGLKKVNFGKLKDSADLDYSLHTNRLGQHGRDWVNIEGSKQILLTTEDEHLLVSSESTNTNRVGSPGQCLERTGEVDKPISSSLVGNGSGVSQKRAADILDTVSHTSDSTASTITSLFEAQFQLGLSDLDEKIAQLQNNLQSMKK